MRPQRRNAWVNRTNGSQSCGRRSVRFLLKCRTSSKKPKALSGRCSMLLRLHHDACLNCCNMLTVVTVFIFLLFCSTQLNQLEAEADQAARLDSAAKATLREAQRAAREGRSLTAAELSSIRTPILNPPTAEELEAERKAAEQAFAICPGSSLNPVAVSLQCGLISCQARSYSC